MLMLARSVAVLAFGALYSYAQEEASPKGVHPCATPDDYAVKARVGYESGRNPVTGQPVHGTYSGAGVGVEHGGPSAPPDSPRSGASSEDRTTLETQLRDRRLPGGKFDHAVAGYLCFPKAKVKKDALGNYVLEHCG